MAAMGIKPKAPKKKKDNGDVKMDKVKKEKKEPKKPTAAEQEELDMQKALEESKKMSEVQKVDSTVSEPEELKDAEKKKKLVVDEVVVLSLMSYFNNFFTKDQVKGSLLGNELDVDRTKASLKLKHDKYTAKGDGVNLKKKRNELAET